MRIMTMVPTGFLVFVAVVVAGLLFPASAVADVVTVRAAAHEGYGRMVFEWPAPVAYRTALEDNRLVVRFDRPIEAALDSLIRPLGRYVRSGQVGSDRRSVDFVLTGTYGLRSFSLGNSVVVDLLDEAQSAVSARPPAEGAAPPKGPGRPVLVRAGEHLGFTRLVFDWFVRVPYRADRQGNRVTVAFDASGSLDLAEMRGRTLPHVTGLEPGDRGGRPELSFTVPPTARLRHFYAGTRVVLDVVMEGDAGLPPAAQTPAPAPAAKPEVVAGARPAPGRPPAPPPTPLTPAKREGAAPLTGAPAAVASAVPTVPSPPPAAAVPAGPVATVTLRIDWDEPVAAAVFRRGGFLWVAFDKPLKGDLAVLRQAAGNAVRDIQALPAERATLLRLDTVAGVNPALRRDGLAWLLDLRQQPLRPQSPVETKAEPNSPVGARVFIPIAEAGNAIPFVDPDVGDTLVVVPAVPLGHGIDQPRNYPQFQVLPTAQGVVVKPLADDLRIRPTRQGVELTAASGLRISSVTAAAVATARLGPTAPLKRIFDLENWRLSGRVDFTKTKQRLQLTVARAEQDGRDKARREMARYYFANGFHAEALSVLDEMARHNPENLTTPEFRLMRGAANLMLGRPDAAKSDLGNSVLDGNDEAAFWRAVAVASEGDLVKAAPEFKRVGGIVRPYPRGLKMPLGLLLIEAAAEAGDTQLASHYLEILGIEEPTELEKSQIAYLDGRLKELNGDFDGAIAKWEEVQQARHRPSRAKAALARAELLRKLQRIPTAAAIEEMEKLRFSWRGDDFEFNLLRRLGRLYLDELDVRNGLLSLRQAATHFRQHPKAHEVTEEMARAFASLYMEGGADKLPPITAIALYDEFKELTPAGQRGDEMIRKLADRLVSVDLLDRAAELLGNQVEYRLQGLEKARIGARLALVQLFARKPDMAVKALQMSDVPGQPPELVDQRRHLMARALMDMNRAAEALELLKDDKTNDASLLRVEIYWNGQDWPNAARVLRELLQNSQAQSGKPLDDRQARLVLDLSVTLTLSGNERAVERLRKDFGPAMETSPYKDAFRLIASPETAGLVDYRTIAGKVAEVQNFQAFMAGYRERLRGAGLSAIN